MKKCQRHELERRVLDDENQWMSDMYRQQQHGMQGRIQEGTWERAQRDMHIGMTESCGTQNMQCTHRWALDVLTVIVARIGG